MERSSLKPSRIRTTWKAVLRVAARTEYRSTSVSAGAGSGSLFFPLDVPPEESPVLGDDLGNVLLLAFFVFVGSLAECPFDVNLTPLLQVLAASLSLFSPDHDGVPFGCLLLFTVRANPGVGCLQGQILSRPFRLG